MTDAELTARLRTNLIAFKSLQVERGLLRHGAWPGVDAFAMPHQQDIHFQQVLFTEPEALAAALPALTDFYRHHGISRWRVAVLPGQPEATRLLAGAGYRPDEHTRTMGLDLADLPADVPPGPPVEAVETMDDVVELNAAAYGARWREVLALWQRPPRSPLRAVVTREAGRALSCGVALDVGDTAGVYLVATAPEARGRGLASAVMRGLLAGARARGRAFSVLQSTPSGFRVYQRLGYRELGAWVNWAPGLPEGGKG